MDPQTIRVMLDYHRWASTRLWECLEQISEEDYRRDFDYSWGSLHALAVHCASGEHIWLNRFMGVSLPMLDPKEFHRASIRTRWLEISGQLRDYALGLDSAGLGRRFDYRRSDGTAMSGIVGQTILHVINHATDHRAAMLMMISMVGGPTFEQDLLMAIRAGAVGE